MWRGISLANKCLLLFGAAIVLIVISSLTIPWFRLSAAVDDGQVDVSRQLVGAWESAIKGGSEGAGTPGGVPAASVPVSDGRLTLLSLDDARRQASSDPFVAEALRRFALPKPDSEHHREGWESRRARRYLFAKAVRNADGGLAGMVVVDRLSAGAGTQLLLNTTYLLSAGLVALGLAVLVFYLITNRLILGPVRSLRETAERVREGDLAIRSQIATGDEFEELSETFNQMLEGLGAGQEQLKAINKSLDTRLNELAERNLLLHESNKLKGEFLANVSHELRTPLNSIIGFTELLVEASDKEAAAGDDSSRLAKRRRYLDHIMASGRSLLELISSLLDMAKIEAGKMEVRIAPMNLPEACQSLVAIMRPQADKFGVELILELGADLPIVNTDAKKFEQIVFNLLSNAIKFTGLDARNPAEWGPDGLATGGGSGTGGGGKPARVTLRAERLVMRSGPGDPPRDMVRISVLDTGPGIPPEERAHIFEKFKQLESGLTKRHTGTGLGLAICKELTSLLQGEIELESEVGRGSMFSVILPVSVDKARASEVSLEMAFRGTLSAQRTQE